MAGVSGAHFLERVNSFRMFNNERKCICMHLSRSGNSQDPFCVPEKKLLFASVLVRKSEREREREHLRTIKKKEKRHSLDPKGCLCLVLVRNSNYSTTGLEPMIVKFEADLSFRVILLSFYL